MCEKMGRGRLFILFSIVFFIGIGIISSSFVYYFLFNAARVWFLLSLSLSLSLNEDSGLGIYVGCVLLRDITPLLYSTVSFRMVYRFACLLT